MSCKTIGFVMMITLSTHFEYLPTVNMSVEQCDKHRRESPTSWPDVCRCLHGIALLYLCDGLQRVAELSHRRLHSSTSIALVVPATRLITVGYCALSVTSSRLWNSLPTDVTSATTLPVFFSGLKHTYFLFFFPA